MFVSFIYSRKWIFLPVNIYILCPLGFVYATSVCFFVRTNTRGTVYVTWKMELNKKETTMYVFGIIYHDKTDKVDSVVPVLKTVHR